ADRGFGVNPKDVLGHVPLPALNANKKCAHIVFRRTAGVRRSITNVQSSPPPMVSPAHARFVMRMLTLITFVAIGNLARAADDLSVLGAEVDGAAPRVMLSNHLRVAAAK